MKNKEIKIPYVDDVEIPAERGSNIGTRGISAFRIKGGNIVVPKTGFIRGGQFDYNTGTGFFLGYSGLAYKFSIGDGTEDNSLLWDGTTLKVNGQTFSFQPFFGDGSDGDVTILADTTLTRDMYYNNLTINGGNLNAGGYRIFVKGTLTIYSGYKIHRNGNDGTAGGNGGGGTLADGTGGSGGAAGVSGAALPDGYLSGSAAAGAAGAGGAGGNRDSNGNAGTGGGLGTDQSNCLISSNGAAGGAAGGGGNDSSNNYIGGAAGAGGAGGTTTASSIMPRVASIAIHGIDFNNPSALAKYKTSASAGGSGGGGGGAGGDANSGGNYGGGGGGGGAGGSGSPGGILIISAKSIVNNGAIEVKGGNGGNGGNGGSGISTTGGGGGGAGGAGGNGGAIFLVYNSLSGSGSISVAAGTAGAGGLGATKDIDGATLPNTYQYGTDGAAGTAGDTGLLVQLQI